MKSALYHPLGQSFFSQQVRAQEDDIAALPALYCPWEDWQLFRSEMFSNTEQK